ncbi:MAG TPA: hypothetical protein ENG63_03465 [Candidatus Desulfofervidus auxilii]|uniref:Uncharacterized protein n=1 Tax=Desulfofervidus auxilii TaxID=1621989 RepID=A0A7C0U1Z9_DESA2|nr:hypothetical protein [Candidatus Desulfofervidus auxilii]
MLFPAYPLLLVTPRKSKFKIGARRVYVDLPWQAYSFIGMILYKAQKEALTAEDVKKEWNAYLKSHKKALSYGGKPMVKVVVRYDKNLKKCILLLRINWSLFLEYLEEKAKNLMIEVDKDGKSIMKVYGDIWNNYFSGIGMISAPQPTYPNFQRFIKLLKRTGDYYQLIKLIDELKESVETLDKILKENYPFIRLHTLNLIMDIEYLKNLVNVANIPASYLLLRNILENFVKIFVYFDLGKYIDPNFILAVMFVYEYESMSNRVFSLKSFKSKFIKKCSKIISSISSNEVNILDIINKFLEKEMPKLGVNKGLLENLSKDYGLEDANLANIYNACSQVIHNQPPLPFYSLLEVKFFKYFLKRYVNSIKILVEKMCRLLGVDVELKRARLTPITVDVKSIKKCIKIAREIARSYESSIMETIKMSILKLEVERPDILIRPLTLACLFYLVSTNFKRIKNLEFIEEDIYDVARILQPFSFRFVESEIGNTLSALQEIIIPRLEKYSNFASLSLEEKRRVISYLLSLYSPYIITDLFKTWSVIHR